MLKKLVGVALLGAVLSGMATLAFADEASVKKAMEALIGTKVERVTKTQFSGLYEVFFNGKIFYTDEKTSFFIANGHLIDVKSDMDVTADRVSELTKIDFSKLPLDLAIKVVKGNGSRKLVVFSDVDCPYCKVLEREHLAKVTNVTIYTFLYPVIQLHPDSVEKSKLIWCAKDRTQAWQDWILLDQLPKVVGKCEVPIEKVSELAEKIGVQGTPNLFFEDGRRAKGLWPYQEIEKAMTRASQAKK